MTKLFLFLLIITGTTMASAQSSWQVLPDTGLTFNAARFEDVYFTDSTTGFAVNLRGYIYKTIDAGRNWSAKLKLTNPLPTSLRSIEFLDDRQTGIAGCVDSPARVYRTSDGGNSWTDIAGSLPDTVLHNKGAICGISHWNNTFYAVGSWASKQAKLYKSTDKGLTWTCYYPDTSLISCAVDVCFTSRDTGFITGGYSALGGFTFNSNKSVVIKTTDGGLTWTRVFSDISIGGRIWKIQALSPRLLVGAIEPYYSDTVAMIKSTDGGNSWTIIGTGRSVKMGAPGGHQTQGIGFINEQHGWLGGYYAGIFETRDGGQTWDTLKFGNNLNRFFVLDSSHVFAGGSEMYFYGGQLPQPPVTRVQRASILPHRLYPVSPNPATGLVKIEFDLLNSTYVLLQVAALDAKRSWELARVWFPAGHYIYYWDGSQAPPGSYIVWLGTNEIPIVQKFALQH